jgi:hypothetical protein
MTANSLNLGLPVGDVASPATGIPRLVDAIGRDLFFCDQHLPVTSPATAPARPSFRQYYEHAIAAADRDGVLAAVPG